MDLSKSIVYNGVSVNSLTTASGGGAAGGYRCNSAKFSDASAVGYLDQRAVADGVDAADVYLSSRIIDLEIGVYGANIAEFWDKQQVLLAAFSPRVAYNANTAIAGFLPLTFFQPTATIASWPTSAFPNGIQMQFYCRPMALPGFTVSRTASAGDNGKGLASIYNVRLIARDPRKYYQTAQSYTISTSSQTGTYRGDYDSSPIVTLIMSASGHSAYSLSVDGVILTLNLTSVIAGTTLTIDYSKRLISDQNGTPRMDVLTSGSFQSISATRSAFLHTNPTGISSATIAYNEAFT